MSQPHGPTSGSGPPPGAPPMGGPPGAAGLHGPPSMTCAYENRGLVVLAVESSVIAVAIITTLMRAVVRLRILKSPSWDDLLLLVGFLALVGTFAIEVKEVEYGLGQHIWCLSQQQLTGLAPLQYACQVLTVASTMFTRLSICVFFLRLFSISKPARMFLYAIAAVIIVMSIVTGSMLIPECTPRAKLLNPSLPGHCTSRERQTIVGYVNGSLSIFCDLALAIFPIYFLRNIQMKLRLKAGICILMSLGVFTAACALVRTVVLAEVTGQDPTYELVSVTIFTWLEAAVAVIVANIPTIKPLFVSRSQPATPHGAPVMRSSEPSSKDGIYKKWAEYSSKVWSSRASESSRRLASDAETADHVPLRPVRDPPMKRPEAVYYETGN